MVKRIIWSKNALIDKIIILEYWHERLGTKTYSKQLDKKFRITIKRLKHFPKMGKIVNGTDIRFLVIDNYQIFYKYTNSEIRILHLWDSRRNPDDLIISID